MIESHTVFLIKTVVNDSEDFETVHGYDKIVEKMANGGISMKIRMAEYGDLAAIYAIYCPYIEQTAITFETEVPSFEQFAKRFEEITSFYPWLVAEEEGTILGYAYASRAFERAAYDWCADLAIYFAMDQPHHGMASRLYEKLMEILEKQHVRVVYALITADNEKSISFHERMAFHSVGYLTKCGYKLEQWHDVVWMQKTLGEQLTKPLPLLSVFDAMKRNSEQDNCADV